VRGRDRSEARNDGENRNTRARTPRAIARIRTRSASGKQHPGEIAPGEHNISSRKLDGSAFGGSRAVAIALASRSPRCFGGRVARRRPEARQKRGKPSARKESVGQDARLRSRSLGAVVPAALLPTHRYTCSQLKQGGSMGYRHHTYEYPGFSTRPQGTFRTLQRPGAREAAPRVAPPRRAGFGASATEIRQKRVRALRAVAIAQALARRRLGARQK
jgi:hypothetical protein